MLILNATTTVKSVMTDRGELISIHPGETSRVIIATRNLIISAINLGDPSQIGIILSGSYELDIAKTISGAIPYLYTDEMEAKSKLLDASIDYKGNLNASKVNAVNEAVIAEKNKELEALKLELQATKDKLVMSMDNESTIKSTADKRYTELEVNFKRVQDERDRYNNLLKESQDQVSSLTDKCNILQSQLGTAQQELTGTHAKITELTSELANASTNAVDTAEIDRLTKEIKSWETLCTTKDSEINELKDSLKSASETIDAMKSEFNAACSKFNITKDDNGEWIQLPI